MMATAAVTACMANYRPDPFDLLNADIEALHRMNHWIQGKAEILYIVSIIQIMEVLEFLYVLVITNVDLSII